MRKAKRKKKKKKKNELKNRERKETKTKKSGEERKKKEKRKKGKKEKKVIDGKSVLTRQVGPINECLVTKISHNSVFHNLKTPKIRFQFP